MSWKTVISLGCCLFVVVGAWTHVGAQRAGAFMGSAEDPAIGYSTSTPHNDVADLNVRLRDGTVQFAFEGRSGFLRSALEALQIPIDSQLLVFSRTSLQGKRISEQNPRAIFFNDRVALGWVRDGDVIEVAAHDESGVLEPDLAPQSGGDDPDARGGAHLLDRRRNFQC